MNDDLLRAALAVPGSDRASLPDANSQLLAHFEQHADRILAAGYGSPAAAAAALTRLRSTLQAALRDGKGGPAGPGAVHLFQPPQGGVSRTGSKSRTRAGRRGEGHRDE